MSERKVQVKYYPPDFDPSKLERRRRTRRNAGPRLDPVRLMAPFSMKCVRCSEYIYKGRKFNAHKEITEERYYSIPIYRFYIRCTRCSSEITFKTDPKNMDYECERGAKRNFEPWRVKRLTEETEEERLDRLEREQAEAEACPSLTVRNNVNRDFDSDDVLADLEARQIDAKTEIAEAEALDEIRARNAKFERAGMSYAVNFANDAIQKSTIEATHKLDREDEEIARRAFANRKPASPTQPPLHDVIDPAAEPVEAELDSGSVGVAESDPFSCATTPAPHVFERRPRKKSRAVIPGIRPKTAKSLGLDY